MKTIIPPKTYFHDHSLSYHRLSSPMTTLENTEGATKMDNRENQAAQAIQEEEKQHENVTQNKN